MTGRIAPQRSRLEGAFQIEPEDQKENGHRLAPVSVPPPCGGEVVQGRRPTSQGSTFLNVPNV